MTAGAHALPGREGGDAIWATAGVCALAAPCMLLYVARAAHYTNGRCRWFAWLDPWLRTAEMTFCVANRFSLFSNMTVPRRVATGGVRVRAGLTGARRPIRASVTSPAAVKSRANPGPRIWCGVFMSAVPPSPTVLPSSCSVQVLYKSPALSVIQDYYYPTTVYSIFEYCVGKNFLVGDVRVYIASYLKVWSLPGAVLLE